MGVFCLTNKKSVTHINTISYLEGSITKFTSIADIHNASQQVNRLPF